jgi:hypothetical protein
MLFKDKTQPKIHPQAAARRFSVAEGDHLGDSYLMKPNVGDALRNQRRVVAVHYEPCAAG